MGGGGGGTRKDLRDGWLCAGFTTPWSSSRPRSRRRVAPFPTGILEGFRAGYGFPPAASAPWAEGFAWGVAYLMAGGLGLHWAARYARRSGMLLRLSE